MMWPWGLHFFFRISLLKTWWNRNWRFRFRCVDVYWSLSKYFWLLNTFLSCNVRSNELGIIDVSIIWPHVNIFLEAWNIIGVVLGRLKKGEWKLFCIIIWAYLTLPFLIFLSHAVVWSCQSITCAWRCRKCDVHGLSIDSNCHFFLLIPTVTY